MGCLSGSCTGPFQLGFRLQSGLRLQLTQVARFLRRLPQKFTSCTRHQKGLGSCHSPLLRSSLSGVFSREGEVLALPGVRSPTSPVVLFQTKSSLTVAAQPSRRRGRRTPCHRQEVPVTFPAPERRLLWPKGGSHLDPD